MKVVWFQIADMGARDPWENPYLVELSGLSKVEEIRIEGGGRGYGAGSTGDIGAKGVVIFVPLHVNTESEQC